MTAPVAPSMANFADKNGRFAGAHAVHAVALQAWIGDLQIPAPACHTPSGTFDPADFRPVAEGVTCKRCLKKHRSRAAIPATDDPSQIVADLIFSDSERISSGQNG